MQALCSYVFHFHSFAVFSDFSTASPKTMTLETKTGMIAYTSWSTNAPPKNWNSQSDDCRRNTSTISTNWSAWKNNWRRNWLMHTRRWKSNVKSSASGNVKRKSCPVIWTIYACCSMSKMDATIYWRSVSENSMQKINHSRFVCLQRNIREIFFSSIFCESNFLRRMRCGKNVRQKIDWHARKMFWLPKNSIWNNSWRWVIGLRAQFVWRWR